jgi:hypothetical protein
MGGACSTNEIDKKCTENSGRKTRKEDLHVDGRIILEWILEKQGGKLWTE